MTVEAVLALLPQSARLEEEMSCFFPVPQCQPPRTMMGKRMTRNRMVPHNAHMQHMCPAASHPPANPQQLAKARLAALHA
jgi:hypothetical protein